MKLKLCFILLVLLNFHLLCFAQDKIIWLQYNRPPWTIPYGEYKNQGYADKIRTFLTTNYLKEYKHSVLPVNPSRAMKIINEENNKLCYGPTFKTESISKNFHYSKPMYVLPQARIIVTNQVYEKLNGIQTISMLDLIQDKNYIFGNVKALYLYPIDLEKFIQEKNVITLSSSSPIRSLLQMMRRNRIDWIYDYNVFIKWETFLNKDYSNTLKTIKVKETKNLPLSVTYIACSKNSFGKEIIDRINKKLTQEDILEFRKEIRKWQLDENTIQSFDKLNKDFFGY